MKCYNRECKNPATSWYNGKCYCSYCFILKKNSKQRLKAKLKNMLRVNKKLRAIIPK